MYQMFPLLALGLIINVVLTFTGIGGVDGSQWHEIKFIELPMMSGDIWKVTWGDLFLVASMALLFVELLRATKTGSDSIVNHALSFVTFVVSLLLFIIFKGFGNSVFFIFMTMTLLDFMAGFIVTTVTARRDLSVSSGIIR